MMSQVRQTQLGHRLPKDTERLNLHTRVDLREIGGKSHVNKSIRKEKKDLQFILDMKTN